MNFGRLLSANSACLRATGRGAFASASPRCFSTAFNSPRSPWLVTGRLAPAHPTRSLSLWPWGSSKSQTPAPSEAASAAPEPVQPSTPADATAPEAILPAAPTETAPADAAANAIVPQTTQEPELVYATPFDPSSVPATTDSAFQALDIATTAVTATPLKWGDLSALGMTAWYTPAGLVRWTLQVFNVTLGMPWFWSIVVGTFLWRVSMFPFHLQSIRNGQKMRKVNPQMQVIREEIQAAKKTQDMLALQRGIMKMQQLNAKHDVNPLKLMLPGFINLPFTLGLFFGVKRLCEEVPQLAVSGFSLLPDLTVTDPYWILPMISVALIQLQIRASAADGSIDLTTAASMPHIMNMMRIFSIITIPLLAKLPIGVLVSLITQSVFMTLQSTILRLPRVRRRLGLEPLGKGFALPSLMESIRFGLNWLKTGGR
ncbi:60Kd inner membrane protein-domain-containing protein [Schizophyllum amplum]|uniref:60Kd inner membrane protein-domain-containing protein n=1 Tax=Schizophyllum amplum TaxID=97359 RepID=A0A550CMZ8_9AGAR|nr:60Kd inner membrane protein-domain-containing protein [Auriculariopsis ampla]